jgi:hypothetical protein
MIRDFHEYVLLKSKRAKEQGKPNWYEGRLTDEEANLRETKEHSTCNWCKFLNDKTRKCSLGHNPTETLKQVCDDWRYAF